MVPLLSVLLLWEPLGRALALSAINALMKSSGSSTLSVSVRTGGFNVFGLFIGLTPFRKGGRLTSMRH